MPDTLRFETNSHQVLRDELQHFVARKAHVLVAL
jgi:hypothetical protein